MNFSQTEYLNQALRTPGLAQSAEMDWFLEITRYVSLLLSFSPLSLSLAYMSSVLHFSI
jgi:hypothetical protein